MAPFAPQNLTGGPRGGLHITDVTNASRTLLMNIHTLQWDPMLLKYVPWECAGGGAGRCSWTKPDPQF